MIPKQQWIQYIFYENAHSEKSINPQIFCLCLHLPMLSLVRLIVEMLAIKIQSTDCKQLNILHESSYFLSLLFLSGTKLAGVDPFNIEPACLILDIEKGNYLYQSMNASEVRANREKLRLKIGSIIGQKTNPHHLSKPIMEIPTSGSITHQHQTQKEKKKQQRKKSLNLAVLQKSFDMFECGEVQINSDFSTFYDIVTKIDEGTQSVVYECRQKDTGKSYAVKVIKGKDQDIIQTLKKQFLILKNLSHESILKSYNLFVDEKRGISHLVTELCHYENLKLYLLRYRAIPEPNAASILFKLLQVINYLHGKGICHRDIKPDNILYNPINGEIKLIDFQISKMRKYEHQKLQMWTRTGTLYYKAPEMFEGSYNQKIDIWAVGIVCYEMLSGRLPFQSTFQKQTIRIVQNQQIDYQKLKITEKCTSFLRKCLQKDPAKRMSAREALQTPFLLKCSDSISTGTSFHKRKVSLQDKIEHQEVQKVHYHDEVSELLNSDLLIQETGIKLVVDFD